MTGEQLEELAEKYMDFEFQFRFTGGCSKFPNVRTFGNIELCDIGHSDKVIVLTGKEDL